MNSDSAPFIMSHLRSDIGKCLPTAAGSSKYQRKTLRKAYQGSLDRVKVLGDESYGHTGCVNALSWAMDGEILVTGGDDTTVRLWRLDHSDQDIVTSNSYPFKCDTVVQTGHRGNIFNAQLLPSSSRIATVAADRQVRVFDVEKAVSTSIPGQETQFSTDQTCIRILKCHAGRTKRIVSEESSDLFLTVAEDGTVRQHDLRTYHRCSSGACPAPLVKLPHDLSTLSLSPLIPYQFVVAGESPYGYLFDRRQMSRVLEAEWGRSCDNEDYITCVRRFGRIERGPGEIKGTEHITGARVSQTNGHEVILSYSTDAVYLYSTRDDVQSSGCTRSPVLTPNSKTRKLAEPQAPVAETSSHSSASASDAEIDDAMDTLLSSDSEDDDDDRSVDLDTKFRVPVILPRARFSGACNARTIKDVNFVGPNDEYVASGSDDGNFFLWQKNNAKLHGIYEGDGSVVNVIESHPRLPLVAVSGIDTTVKLFAPSNGLSAFSRMQNAEMIVSNNVDASRRNSVRNFGFARLYMQYRLAAMSELAEDGDEEPQCTYQ